MKKTVFILLLITVQYALLQKNVLVREKGKIGYLKPNGECLLNLCLNTQKTLWKTWL